MIVPWYFTVLAYILCGFVSIKIAALIHGKEYFLDRDDGNFCSVGAIIYFLFWPVCFFCFVCIGLGHAVIALSKLVVGYRPPPLDLTPEERGLRKREGIDP
jgi:hypothetical protein